MSIFSKNKNKLSLEALKSLTDSELDWVVFEDINEKLEKKSKEPMSRGQEAFYATWLLGLEVNNGGFNQFYFNKGPKLMDVVIKGFALFGADKYEKLAKRAHDTFNSIKTDLMKLNDGTLENFSKSYQDNPLNDFDKEFYDLEQEQTLENIRVKYIRQHPEEFIGS